MARRISILSFLVALTIIASFYGRDAYAQRTFSAYSVEELNKILAGEEIREMTLSRNDRVSFTQDFRYDYDSEYRYLYNDYVPRSSPYISLQNHIFMYGQPETDTLEDFRIDINILGQGIWRLQALPDGTPNTTNLRAGAEVVFHVSQAGTLELMPESTIKLYEPMNSFAKFALESPEDDSDNRVTLNLRGSNVIDASFLEFGHNSSLGFDLTNANDAEPIVHMIARHQYGTVGNPSDPQYNSTEVELNMLGFKFDPGSSLSGSNVRLIYEDVPLNGLRFSYDPIDANENYDNQYFLVRGENWNVVKDASGGRLTGRIAMTAPEDYEQVANNLYRRIIHIDGFTSLVGVVEWTGSESNYWNATSQNWTGMQNYLTNSGQQNHSFLHGDRVVFNQDGRTGTVYINHGGVQIGDIDSSNFDDSRTNPGMIVESGDYTFVNLEEQGQGGVNPIINNPAASIIGIDGPGSVLITAQKLNAGYDTSNAAQVTFRSPNSYWGGTTVENGARLTLANTGAVGTGLLNLKNSSDPRNVTTLVFHIEKTDPNIPNENFKSVFYNILNTEAGTTIIKRDPYDLTLERDVEDAANDNIINNKADTIIEHGILRKYIPTGVLTVNKGAAYHTLGYFDDVNNFVNNPDEPEPKVQSRYYAAAEENAREAMYHDRQIAGLKDGDDGGGTVDMSAFLLTINTANARDEFAFSGLITGIGSVTNKNGIVSTGGKVEKAGVGVQIFGNAHNEYPGGTDIVGGTLVGSHVLTKDMSDYQPFGEGDIRINSGALLAFELTGDTAALYAATLHNTITGEGDLQVGYDRINEDPDLGPTAQILHLLSSDSDYTGQTFVSKGKVRVSNVRSTGMTREVLLSQDSTAIQFIDMNDSSMDNPYDRIINGEGGVEALQNDPNAMSSGDQFEPTRVYLRSYNYDKDLDGDGIYDPTPMGERSSYTGTTIVMDGKANEETELHLLDVQATGKTVAVDLKGAYSTLVLDFAPLEDGDPDEQEQFYDRFITGNGNLIKDSEGIAVLTKEDPSKPDNNYMGYTLVRQGTLKLDYAAGTGASVSGGGGAVTIAKDAILELAFDGRYEKNIDGQGILAKSGAGTISTLGGISTYTGGTHLYSGTLSYNNLDPSVAGNLGKGPVTFMNGGGILQNRSEVTEFTEKVLIHAGSTATFDTRADLIITGVNGISHVDDEGTGEQSHFVKTGSATMTIDTTVVNWTGSTTVEQGILKNNIPDGTVLTVHSGAWYYTGDANRTVSELWGAGSVMTAAGKNFTVDYNGTDKDNDFEGTITGDGNLVKIGTGTFELSGYNDYTGSTLVDNGVLIGNIATGTALTVMSTGEYRAGNATRQLSSLQGGGLVDMQNQALVIHQNRTDFTPNFQGMIQNGGWLSKTGIGTQIFSGREYTFKGNVDLHEGFLQIGGSNSQTVFRTAGDMNVWANGGLYLDSRGKVEVGQLFNVEGTLKINLGTSKITARDVTIGTDAVLNVSGVSSSDKEVVIISSTNEIQGDFLNVTVAGEASGVDFLDFGVGKSVDKKEIYVGQTLAWYRSHDAHGTFTLTNAEGSFNVDVSLNDVTGTFDSNVWDGKTLTKKGPGKLILSAVNNYTGATVVEAGTLMLTNEKATLGSKEIDLVSKSSVLELDYSSLTESGGWTKGLTTSITGEGDVYKTGDSIAVLGGNHTFSGQTFVNGGVLLLDGRSQSRTWVRSGAGFGGNGTLDNKLTLDSGSYYYWRFDGTVSGSDHLTVNSSVDIGEGVAFKPVATVSQEKLANFSGLTVISAIGGVYGRFDGIVAGTNPFYMYELDYSDPRKVKISGFLRDEPLPLSDIVASSLTMAQTRMYRTAYQQIQREWMSECPHHGHARTGQDSSKRTAWMNFIGRGGDLASSYFASDYSFQSYGVQAGLSLISNCTRSAGILFGREENKLSNHSDKVEGEDHYLGFYYGQVFSNGYDFKGYIGGGWQKNRLERTSNGYRYGTRYNGNTYNTNFEFGRRFLGDRNWLIRPFAGFDLNVTWIDKSMENSLDLVDSNEYRGYGKSDLAQVFLRAGIEATKTWERIDFRMGTQVRWNVADSKGSTKIYYPALDGTAVRSSVTGYSSDLGRFEWGFNFGLNWFLTERRNTLVFLDFDGDLFAERPGDPLHGTGTVGFVWRF